MRISSCHFISFFLRDGKNSLFTKQLKNQIYRIVTNSIAMLLWVGGAFKIGAAT
tara:strand:+ start:399 stop:560 length:162 start_codon:yes stop_codon:yes gene_type:complete